MRANAMRVGFGPLALLLLALAPWSGAAAEERAEVARATTVTGEVVLDRDGAGRPLRVDTGLIVGDAVRTAGGARARLTFVDGSMVVMGAFTRVVIKAYVPREQGVIGVLRGIVRATVGALGPEAAFEIETATGVASVRGTEWIVDAGPDSTAVFVESGRVTLSGVGPAPRDTVVLGAGEGSTVRAGAPPAPPARWAASRVANIRARTDLR